MTTLVKPRTLFIGLALLRVLAIWLSLALGPVSLPLLDTLKAALRMMGAPIDAQGLEQAELILGQIRLPRTLLGLAVGGVLALSGVAMQGLFRNPLADPGLGVGAAVAAAGMIGFVGLVVPHLVRLLAGPDHRVLLPASILAGASLLLFADLVARLALAPAELPIGIVTAFIGAPFFLYLLLRGRA